MLTKFINKIKSLKMNKKSFLIITLFLSGILFTGSFSGAYALFTQSANSANFGISQEIDYYLKGTFNSWEQNNTYKFVNNTAGMAAEENKIKEYKLENIPLDKASELKVWANNDSWYQDGSNNCTYEHRWSNAISYSGEGHNYIVPMSSNTYSFYLKFFNNGSSVLYITANKDVLYFIPSSDWENDDATFAIELYNNDNTWADNVTESTTVSGALKFAFGTTYSKYKFARRNTDNTSTWNASNIQTIGNSDTNNCFSLYNSYWNNWDADESHGVWSTR